VGLTVFPHDDKGCAYKQAPFEAVDADRYATLTAGLEAKRNLLEGMIASWSQFLVEEGSMGEDAQAAVEMQFDMEPACTGEACEIKAL
jgi:hypothetical protein